MRRPLASPPVLLGMIVVFALAFAVLRPALRTPSSAAGIDPALPAYLDKLDVAYLKADMASRAYTNAELQVAFAALARSGHVIEADAMLTAYPNFVPGVADRYRLELERTIRSTQRSAARGLSQGEASLVASLRQVVDREVLGDPELLSRAMDVAVGLADPGLAIAIATRLAATDAELAVVRLRGYANDLGFEGHSPAAVAAVNAALALVVDPRARFELELERLQRLVAAGERERAHVLAAATASAAPADTEALARLAPVLLGIERPDLAAETYVRLAGIDTAGRVRWLLEAARWSESIGQTEIARRLLNEVLKRAPRQREAHRRLARLDEWAGEPEWALAHWRAVVVEDAAAAAPPDLDALDKIARLAELTWRPAVAAEALRTRLVHTTGPSRDDLERLVGLYERDGRPDEAVRALEQFEEAATQPTEALALMAEVQRRHHAYRDALLTWERLAARTDATALATLNRMEMHWRLGERARAFAVASGLESMVLPDASAVSGFQVQLLSELGWRHRHAGLHELARSWLDRVEDTDWRALITVRLVDWLREACRAEEALELAESGWRATASADLAIVTLSLAVEMNAPAPIQRILDSDVRANGLDRRPAYWNTLAAFHADAGRSDAAASAWRRALALAPTDPDAIEGLVRLATDAGNGSSLAALIEAHRPVAEVTPSLAESFAAAETARGDAPAAARWRAAVPRVPASMSRDCHATDAGAPLDRATG